MAKLFDAYRVFYKQDSDRGLARKFIVDRLRKNESVIFFASDNAREFLCFVQLSPSFSSVLAERIWILNDLYVDEMVRRTGVAKKLLEAAKN
ncbi:MAG: GNAT superfamily N-acetyltransferase [Cellvibrionaceae bacterium]